MHCICKKYLIGSVKYIYFQFVKGSYVECGYAMKGFVKENIGVQ